MDKESVTFDEVVPSSGFDKRIRQHIEPAPLADLDELIAALGGKPPPCFYGCMGYIKHMTFDPGAGHPLADANE